MKKLIFIAVISLLSMHCFSSSNLLTAKSFTAAGVKFISINTTAGQELIDLQQALDSGAITQEEYDELKLQIIERYDEPADSTAHEIMKMIFGSEDTPADSTDTN